MYWIFVYIKTDYYNYHFLIDHGFIMNSREIYLKYNIFCIGVYETFFSMYTIAYKIIFYYG